MKKNQFKMLALIFLSTLAFTGCVSTMPLNKEFYNSKKVGIILQIDSISMAKAGGQGLLDMALTPGNKFREPLKAVQSQLNLKDALKSEISNFMTQKNKQFEFLEGSFNYDALEKFEKPDSNKKYSKKDFRNLKSKNNIDEVLYIKVKHGILVSYYGFIELDKQGYVDYTTEVVDLSDNSLLQQDAFQNVAKINGNWKEGENYSNLKNSIQEAISNSINILKSKF